MYKYRVSPTVAGPPQFVLSVPQWFIKKYAGALGTFVVWDT